MSGKRAGRVRISRSPEKGIPVWRGLGLSHLPGMQKRRELNESAPSLVFRIRLPRHCACTRCRSSIDTGFQIGLAKAGLFFCPLSGSGLVAATHLASGHAPKAVSRIRPSLNRTGELRVSLTYPLEILSDFPLVACFGSRSGHALQPFAPGSSSPVEDIACLVSRSCRALCAAALTALLLAWPFLRGRCTCRRSLSGLAPARISLANRNDSLKQHMSRVPSGENFTVL